MKLLPSQTDEPSLRVIGEEACDLLQQREYTILAELFGYELAYGRDPAAAIQADHERAESAPFETAHEGRPLITVKFYEPNPLCLLGLVECMIPVGDRAAIMLELIVHGEEEEKEITLEDISGLGCCPVPLR